MWIPYTNKNERLEGKKTARTQRVTVRRSENRTREEETDDERREHNIYCRNSVVTFVHRGSRFYDEYKNRAER